MLLNHLVKSQRIKQRQRNRFRVGKIDDNGIVKIAGVFYELIGILIDHTDARVIERALIDTEKNLVLPGQPGHGRIEIDQSEVFQIGIFEDFPGGQPIAAPQKQDILTFLNQPHQGVDQGFMISFLVVGAELGAPIYKEPIIVFPLSNNNFLIPGLFLVNDFILILVLFAV